MSLFSTRFCKHNEEGIPGEIVMTLETGEKIYYERSGNESLSTRNKLASFSQPKHDLAEQMEEQAFWALQTNFDLQLRSLDQEHQTSMKEAQSLYDLEKLNILNYAVQKGQENDQLYTSVSTEMIRNYTSLKKHIECKAVILQTPEEKVNIMIDWLQKTEESELLEAAQMIEFESEYILERVNVRESKWDCFLSNVNKESGDVGRKIADALEKKRISIWRDKEPVRLEKHAMIEGIVDSEVFVIILTPDYFRRPHCVFEYCVAVLAGRSVIIVAECDSHSVGTPIGSFKSKELFKHNILNQEVIEINRSDWKAFTLKLSERIQSTIKFNAIKSVGALKASEHSTMSVVPEVGGWNTNKICSNLLVHADRVTMTSQIGGKYLTGVGTKEFEIGRQSFDIEIIKAEKVSLIIVGVASKKFGIRQDQCLGKLGLESWAYSRMGTVSCGSGWDVYAFHQVYGEGDIITITLDFDDKTVEFFKNGKALGIAFKNLTPPVYPAVSLKGKGTSVRLILANN